MPSRSVAMDARYLADDTKATVRKLVASECRGHGDMEPAIGRLETRYGLPYWTTWAFLYRKPKDVSVAFYLRVKEAYAAQCEAQKAHYEREAKTTREAAGTDTVLIRAAAALDRAASALDGADVGEDQVVDQIEGMT